MLNANNASLSVFVTAATSSLGREVVRQLVERGHRVTGVTDSSDGATQLRKLGALPAFSDPFRAGEFKSMIKMASADVVVHLFSQAFNGFPHKGLEAAKRAQVITDSTAALLEAVQDTSVKQIIYVSDASIYGDTHGEWVDETAPAKGSFGKVARRAEEKVLAGSTPACVLRAGTVYGAHDPGMKFLGETAQRGRSIYMGDSHAYRNWVHEADLAKAIALVAENNIAGEVFNIADDKPGLAAEFVSYVATSLGLPVPSASNPPAFALSRLTSDVQREALNTSVRIKNDKAKQVLGWTPRYASYQAGIDQVLMIWRSEPVVG
jgi:nucleoside-diphosphate-sugar epimerase